MPTSEAARVRSGDAIRVLSLSSPVAEERVKKGCDRAGAAGLCAEVRSRPVLARHGFFAGPAEARCNALRAAIAEPVRGRSSARAEDTALTTCLIASASTNYAQDFVRIQRYHVGARDLSPKFRWVTIHGPMVAAGLDHGADAPEGYDRESFERALAESKGWSVALKGESISAGSSEGTLLGGCLNLVEATIGTPWELDTRGAILVLEDRAMKPWQVDRALMHLKQAGKLRGVTGVASGNFLEQSAARYRERERCGHAYLGAARGSHRVRRANRAHFSTDAHASIRRSSASIGRWRRQIRNSGASLRIMIFAITTCS